MRGMWGLGASGVFAGRSVLCRRPHITGAAERSRVRDRLPRKRFCRQAASAHCSPCQALPIILGSGDAPPGLQDRQEQDDGCLLWIISL